jgi:hypothetical protein
MNYGVTLRKCRDCIPTPIVSAKIAVTTFAAVLACWEEAEVSVKSTWKNRAAVM